MTKPTQSNQMTSSHVRAVPVAPADMSIFDGAFKEVLSE